MTAPTFSRTKSALWRAFGARKWVGVVVLAGVVLAAGVWTATASGTHTDGRGTFIDDDGVVHEASINGLAAADITRGCNPPDNTSYCPNDPVTRAQMATFLVRALDLPGATDSPFTDTAGSVHHADIDALAQADVTRGCNPPDNTRYCPNDPVTRAQMATFLVRALDLATAEDDLFTDDDGSIHESSINALATADITRGCNPPDNTSYCPNDPVTRAQMATFLVRALDGVDPILNQLSLRDGLTCSKDGTSCSRRLTLAQGVQLEVREGWYQVVPYRSGEEQAFKASNTNVSMRWNGSDLSPTSLGLDEGSSPATRLWRVRPPTLTSGTHTLRATWRWNGEVTQRVTHTITVP